MDGTHRHLIILEVGLYFSGYPKHKERPIKPAGHWFEQIEALAAAWPDKGITSFRERFY